MEGKLQHQIAFYLTGRRGESDLRPLASELGPALFARYADLTSLRYDLPVILNRDAAPQWAILSLSRLIDDAVAGLGDGSVGSARVARHGYRLEGELRRELAENGSGDLAKMWNAAAERLAVDDEAILGSAKGLAAAFQTNGQVIDAGADLPSAIVRHAWAAVQAGKARAFRQKAERLLYKLRGIFAAEMVGSAAGRAPDRLKAGVGSSFAASFDFSAMSTILGRARPESQLSDARRVRINGLIDVLENQRFYPLGEEGPEPYIFSFDRCTDALAAFNERYKQAVELAKTLAVAELEAAGEYRESVHDAIFSGFGANGLDPGEMAPLPDYLVCTDGRSANAAETAQLVELLAAGLPFKVLVQTDDVLEPSIVAEGHAALGLRARQLVNTAIGLTDVFVLQASASEIFRKRGSLLSGLTYDGPALFSVFSGANEHTAKFPTYLVAAAAVESRVFPTLTYDPSAGPDWASRLDVSDNPSSESDWPEYTLNYEDEKLQARSEACAFTLADFMAMDERYASHFAVVADADRGDAMIAVPEALETQTIVLPESVPYVTLVDADARLQHAIVDDRTLLEVRRCRTMWHSLQELGGIHNSHAERMLARERQSQSAAVQPARTAEIPTTETPAAVTAAVPAEALVAEPVVEEIHGDDPYIETERCTSCNECTNVNNRLFAYNENQQAFIADPDAGTYRNLVEAAEGCQVSIIHPGKPRNPKEPGLEDLIRRAAEFN